MSDKIRVRFAPSPTGHLHIGGARTALFNWLFARHNNGTFILRIEDTDRSRSTEEYIDSIIEGLKWLKLDWDEGPYRQTDRFEIYKRYALRLVEEGKAYYCYCTPEELEQRRKEALAQGKTPKYDGRCKNIKEPVKGRSPVIRFAMPQEGEITVNDLIKGNVVFDNAMLDDLIIIRSDGTPTYNFTVVVDDVDMNITHVIRGDDHLNNTPKQIHIYNALGYKLPFFAHLPMILGSDRTRLSKRHGATSVLSYREMGYLSEALVNYLVRLGWSYGDQEIFTREELIKYFSFDNVGKSSAVFNPEKLLWLNSQYMMNSKNEELAKLVIPFLQKEGIIDEQKPLNWEWLSKLIGILKERNKTLVSLAQSMKVYIMDEFEYDEKAKNKFLNKNNLDNLIEVYESLKALDKFVSPEIEKIFHDLSTRKNIKLSMIAQPVRVSVTGKAESPGIYDVLEILGKEKSLRRIERAISLIRGY